MDLASVAPTVSEAVPPRRSAAGNEGRRRLPAWRFCARLRPGAPSPTHAQLVVGSSGLVAGPCDGARKTSPAEAVGA